MICSERMQEPGFIARTRIRHSGWPYLVLTSPTQERCHRRPRIRPRWTSQDSFWPVADSNRDSSSRSHVIAIVDTEQSRLKSSALTGPVLPLPPALLVLVDCGTPSSRTLSFSDLPYSCLGIHLFFVVCCNAVSLSTSS